MNEKEFAAFAMALKTYYPKEALLPNKEALGLWFMQLRDLDYTLAETALCKWVAVNKWSPTIADIRQEAASITDGDLPEWGDGWEQVLKAIAKYGMYRPHEALESMDDITRQCVERLGFINLCISENQAADRANFRSIYEAYRERQRRENLIPLSTKQRIGHLNGAKITIEGGDNG